MATQVYRVSRVLTAAGSPVARLQARNEEGHEVGLELPAVLVERTAPGHVLVLNWSIHALPELLAPAAAQEEPQVIADQARAHPRRALARSTMHSWTSCPGAGAAPQPARPHPFPRRRPPRRRAAGPRSTMSSTHSWAGPGERIERWTLRPNRS